MTLDYARQKMMEALNCSRRVVLATSGPAGVQAGEFPCEAVGLVLYLLVPRTSDHLFNLEHNLQVTLLSPRWELKGRAQVVPPETGSRIGLDLLRDSGSSWCALVRVEPRQLQIHREEGWGSVETFDI